MRAKISSTKSPTLVVNINTRSSQKGEHRRNVHGYEAPNSAPPKAPEPKIKTVGSVFDFVENLQILLGNARILPMFIFARFSPFVNLAVLMGA